MSAEVYTPEKATGAALGLRQEIERRKRSREQADEAQRHFRKFIPLAWPIVEPARPYLTNCFHIDAIADHMQAVADGQIQNLLMVVPPGSAKSTIASVMFPAWKWVSVPQWRSTWASYDAALSTRDSVKCRDLILSDWYTSTFRLKWSLKPDQNEKTYYYNTEKGFRMSTSVDGKGTGHRSDLLGIDDALSTDARFSQTALESCVRWYENVWYNRLISMESGSRVVIGQRVADNDLIGHLLRQGGWELLHIPMEYNPARSRVTVIGWKDPRTKAGELMFEPLWPRSVVEDLKRNQDVFSTQYQGIPTVEGGGILKSHWWNYWQPADTNLPPVRVKMPDGTIQERRAVELPDQFDCEIQSWDLPFKDLKTSDFAAGLSIGVRGANRYITDTIHDRLDLPGTISAVRRMSGLHPKTYVKLVEDKANGPALIQSLRNEVSGLTEITPRGSKVNRAVAATPELRSGNWFIPHPDLAPWVGNPENPPESGFLAEATVFPFGQNDDWVDSWSMGAEWLQTEGVNQVFPTSEKDIRAERIEIPPKWPRLFGLSVTWNEVGAVWIARRPETGEHFLFAEHAAPAGDPALHAAALLKQGEWVPGVMHAASQGRDEKDGQALATKYRQMGLKHLSTVMDNTVAEIADLQEALRAGKLRVFGDMARFFDQLRMFRKDDGGKLPQYNAGVIYAALVAWKHRDKARPVPDPDKPRETMYRASGPGQQGWMA